MSHTNSTPNYNLPQFVGTDKPTWLNDVNGAFSSIDTQMKANADSATTANTTASTAQNAIGTLSELNTTAKTDLVNALNEVNTKVGTAQETANTAIGSANKVSSDLTIFEQKFNLSNITQGNSNNYSVTGTVNNGMTLAQNSDGSIFLMTLNTVSKSNFNLLKPSTWGDNNYTTSGMLKSFASQEMVSSLIT